MLASVMFASIKSLGMNDAALASWPGKISVAVYRFVVTKPIDARNQSAPCRVLASASSGPRQEQFLPDPDLGRDRPRAHHTGCFRRKSRSPLRRAELRFQHVS